MGSFEIAEVLLLLLAVVVFRNLFPSNVKTDTASESTETHHSARDKDHNFATVSFISCGNRCTGARALNGRRYLPHKAPTIPLQGCSKKECRCRYSRHADRRSGTERRRALNPSVGHWLSNPNKFCRRKRAWITVPGILFERRR